MREPLCTSTRSKQMRLRFPPSIRAVTTAAVVMLASGCTVDMDHLIDPPRQDAFTTKGTWNSMVYAAATDSGVVVIDLGWSRSEARFLRALEALGADPSDVTHVFVTHSHRDHISGWPWVEHARFHMAQAEVARFEGNARHSDWPSRLMEGLKRTPTPAPGALTIEPFTADTVFDLGEPLVALNVSGHTPGSAAYLFRGVLFAGDAVSHMPVRGFHGAATLYTDDVDGARSSLQSLFRDRLDMTQVQWVCTAHGKCFRPTESLLDRVTR